MKKRWLPFGGLYIAGGLAPKLLPLLKTSLLDRGYFSTDLMKDITEKIPVYVVLDDDVGLLGAKVRATRLLASASP